jgi:hypothetical protein
MGMSNYIPSSALTKAGVCTSITRPASPYDGQVIYETDTDRTLVWNGSAWVFLSTSTANQVGLEHISTQSFTAATQVDFINVFSSQYTNYRVMFDSWSVTVAENHFFRLRDASGIVSSVSYFNQRLESSSTTVTGILVGGGTNTSWYPTYINTGTGVFVSGHMDIFRPNETVATTAVGQFIRNDPAAMYTVQFAGHNSSTTAMTGFSLVRNTTATMSGRVSVYGYRS